MDQEQTQDARLATQPKTPKGIFVLLVCLGVFAVFYFLLGLFDNSTELTPTHEDILMVVFFVAGVTGAIWCGVAFYSTRNETFWRQIRTAIPALILGFISSFLFFDRLVEVAEGWIDFPPANTQSRQGLLMISRAYQAHGKGRSWKIQTTPIWSNLDITQDDYSFMLSHRRPEDFSRNPDEISSRGYFCARVTLQQSGDALRVMNAGSHRLPKGTVIVCPLHPEQ